MPSIGLDFILEIRDRTEQVIDAPLTTPSWTTGRCSLQGGTCQNSLSVRHDLVCSKTWERSEEPHLSPRNIVELRRMATERLRALSQTQDSEQAQAQTHLQGD